MSKQIKDITKIITQPESYKLVEALKPFISNNRISDLDIMGILNMVKIYHVFNERFGGKLFNMQDGGKGLLHMLGQMEPGQIDQIAGLLSLINTVPINEIVNVLAGTTGNGEPTALKGEGELKMLPLESSDKHSRHHRRHRKSDSQ